MIAIIKTITDIGSIGEQAERIVRMELDWQ